MKLFFPAATVEERDFHPGFNDACLRCHVAVETGHGRDWRDGVQECAADTDFNSKIDATCKQLEYIEEGRNSEAETFHPPSALDSIHCVGEYSFVELLFLSEHQVLTHTGALPQEVGLAVATRLAEDGQSTIKGCYVRSDDLPDSVTWQVYNGFRKVRLFSDMSYSHAKKVLRPDNQIAAEQGSSLMAMLERRRAAKDEVRPTCTNLATLKSLQDLKRKADKLEDVRRMQEMELSNKIATETGEADASGMEPAVDEARKAALSRFSVTKADAAAAPENIKKKRRLPPKTGDKMQPAEKAPSEVSVSSAGKGSKTANPPAGKSNQGSTTAEKDKLEDAHIKEALKHDPPMQKVCLALHTIPECIPALNPHKCMGGAKLGNQCFAVVTSSSVLFTDICCKLGGFAAVCFELLRPSGCCPRCRARMRRRC